MDKRRLQSSSPEPAGETADGGGLERPRPPPDGGGEPGQHGNSGRSPGCPAAPTDQVSVCVHMDLECVETMGRP